MKLRFKLWLEIVYIGLMAGGATIMIVINTQDPFTLPPSTGSRWMNAGFVMLLVGCVLAAIDAFPNPSAGKKIELHLKCKACRHDWVVSWNKEYKEGYSDVCPECNKPGARLVD